MLDLSQYTTDTFLPAVDRLLADKSARLSVPVSILLQELTPQQIKARGDAIYPNKPRIADYVVDVLPAFAPGPAGLKIAAAAASHALKRRVYAAKRKPLEQLLHQFTIERPIISLTEQERGLLRGTAALVVERVVDAGQWAHHLALMAWCEGHASILVPFHDIAQHNRMPESQSYLASLLKETMPKHHAFLAATANTIAQHMHGKGSVGAAIRAALNEGARWMDDSDLLRSPTYSTTNRPGALIVGYTPERGVPVFFSGHESLITIGGPGTGKSSGQVIPNLLRYPGSCVVLDVKNELWEKTAGYRAKRFGNVYRFAPTDPKGLTHRYNPFDFISSNPDQAANDCAVFSYQVVLENPKLHDPYWENKGRDFIWAYAMIVALKSPRRYRNIQGLAEFVSLPLIDEPDQPIIKTIEGLKRLAASTGIPDLEAAANALKGGMSGTRLESVMDTARRYLTPFARAAYSRIAMSASDWSPQELRQNPGTTLYICMNPGDLATYAPLVRLVLYQHLRILQDHAAKPGEMPITYFLDEMPRLGNFESILEMQDIGRSAGLRLWMFAQHLGQLSKAFGSDRYRGIVEACRVRQYMQPDSEAANHLSLALGDVKNLFSGKREALAEPHDLMGLAYTDKTIVTTRGDLPMALLQKRAHEHTPHLILPPPPLKRATPAP